MRPISSVLPGFLTLPTRAPWPVWNGSVAGPVKFMPMTRKEAAKIWHAARKWDRQTRQKGRHGGIIGRTALDVLYALAFDFLNYTTGRLDPRLDAIAEKAGCCQRTVVNALARLRDLGMVTWQRRCEESRDDKGRFRLRQSSNAYAVLPASQWIGYRDPTEPPPPSPDTLGAPEPVPDPITAAVEEITHGQPRASLAALEVDTRDPLAMALAAFGRAIEEREAGVVTGMQELPRNIPLCSNHTGENRFAAPKAPRLMTRDEVEAEKARQFRALFGPDYSG